MSFAPADLLSKLRTLESDSFVPSRYLIAFSGGLDSTVLLHALASTASEHGRALLAVHVDHGLHANSARWARECEHVARDLGVDIVVEAIKVDVGSGQGPEAAARDARYAVLEKHITADDWLLSAHHEDDQAETLLLNLLRGSGPLGVAGIPASRAFGAGLLVRPLLDIPRRDLRAYARVVGQRWEDDPSNASSEFDRNFLRNEVLPAIEQRWPDAAQRLSKSAALARDAASLLGELADIDLGDSSPDRIPLTALGELSLSRARNALRRAAQRVGLLAPPPAQLEKIVEELIPAREDAEPLVRWPGAEARRYRDHLYLMSTRSESRFDGAVIGIASAVELGPGLGRLQLVAGRGKGLSSSLVESGLHLELRRGGEEIKPYNQIHTRKLKKLLQEHAVVPWMRDVVPLVYAGDRLVAVADLWLADDAAAPDGLTLEWCDRPPLH